LILKSKNVLNNINCPKMVSKKIVGFCIFSLVAFGGLISWLEIEKYISLPIYLATIIRWLSILGLLYWMIQKKSLTTTILIAMVIGMEIGYDFPEFAVNLKFLSKIFLQMIKTIIAPLLFGTLVLGIAGHSDVKQVGRMGWKSILYFEIVTTLALIIGLLAINFTKAGVGIVMPTDMSEKLPEVQAQNWQDIIIHIFPENIAKAIFEGQVLQIVVFSILFGVSLAMLPAEKKKPMLEFTESLAEVMFKFTQIVMYFAPIGVGAAMAVTVGHMGLDILKYLFALLFTLYGALLVFILFVLVPIGLMIKLPFRKFVKAISEPVSIAFATTSSESALPKAMLAMEKLGVPRKIVSFVMPMGYSFNLDGTTLYLALASIFVAQAAGIDMPISQQIILVITLMLTSKGVAGVPRASLVILLGTAASFGLPLWPIYLILGIDELMDMARTSVNVIGNCLATVVIAKWEGEFVEGQKI
jgi:proton glutamate symport protein